MDIEMRTGKHGNGVWKWRHGKGGHGNGRRKGGAWKWEGVAAGWEAALLQGRYLHKVAIQCAARGGDLVGLLSADPKALL